MIRIVIAWISLGMSALFGFAYYGQHFKWRGCFNDLGRCYDPETGIVYLKQSGGVWLALTVLTLSVSLYQFRKIRLRRQS